jgi:hypothetical protein
MKKVLIGFLFIAASMAFQNHLYAQQSRIYPRVKVVLLQNQLEEVKRRINLDDKKSEKFDKLYESYINEIASINSSNRFPAINDLDLDKYSDNQIEKIFMKQSERSRKLLSVREKYFWLFRSFLSPKEILTMYRVEREVVNSALQEIHRREKNKEE